MYVSVYIREVIRELLEEKLCEWEFRCGIVPLEGVRGFIVDQNFLIFSEKKYKSMCVVKSSLNQCFMLILIIKRIWIARGSSSY